MNRLLLLLLPLSAFFGLLSAAPVPSVIHPRNMVKVCKRPPLLSIFNEKVLETYKLLKEKLPNYNDPVGDRLERMNELLHSRGIVEEEYRVGLSTDNPADDECPFGSKNLFYKIRSWQLWFKCIFMTFVKILLENSTEIENQPMIPFRRHYSNTVSLQYIQYSELRITVKVRVQYCTIWVVATIALHHSE